MPDDHLNLIISSKDNSINGVSNPITIPLNNIGNNSKIVRIVVKSASIVNNFYNIRDGINNKLYVTGFNDTVPYSAIVTIPEGQYTVTTLLDYLNSTPAFITLGAELSFDVLTNRIITNVLTATTFTYLYNASGLLPNNKAIEGAYIVLGLIYGFNFTYNIGANRHPNMCDLSGVKNIYVETNFTKMNSMDKNGFRDIGVIIPLDVPYLSVKAYINQEQQLEIITRDTSYSQNLSSPSITLLDVDGNILNTQGVNWEMAFKIFYETVD